EGELIAFFNMDKPFLAGTPNIDARSAQAIEAAIGAPDYARVTIPALALYAFESNDTNASPARAEIRKLEEQIKRENMEAFRRGVVNGQVLAMENASHYIIQSNQSQVIEEIRQFAR
ncbi:MAG TPA: hypothetical protein VFP37_04065, partial [Steroidobacteraceae bacterium]|nr:hypothetical protein [Steroidobacteraceae bacterium]